MLVLVLVLVMLMQIGVAAFARLLFCSFGPVEVRPLLQVFFSNHRNLLFSFLSSAIMRVPERFR